MEAALFARERGEETEVSFLELVTDFLELGHGVLGRLEAAAHQGRVGGPVRVIHDMVEDVVDGQRRAAFLVLQHVGADSERARNLEAVRSGPVGALLEQHDLGAVLSGDVSGHHARSASADDDNLGLDGFIGFECSARCGSC